MARGSHQLKAGVDYWRPGGGGCLFYSYVSNESNIYRKTFDHRTSDPYNEYPDESGTILIGLRVLLIMTAIRRVL